MNRFLEFANRFHSLPGHLRVLCGAGGSESRFQVGRNLSRNYSGASKMVGGGQDGDKAQPKPLSASERAETNCPIALASALDAQCS
ncbi:unnamed protein product [Strongylus vulgaris]|uniref:Uncharacterized protein n=1 Tax=Strongylus vulgaris TaxID=40348 RepID=A0A3P7IKR2_STRVU|nr:unnamed protein product [Strongylus vulgaris]